MFCFGGINKFCWWLLAENIEWIFIVGFKFPIWQTTIKVFFLSLFSFLKNDNYISNFYSFSPTKFSVVFQKFLVLSHREKPKRLLLFLWFLDLKNTKTIWKNCLQKTTLLLCFFDIFCNKKLKEVIKVSTIFFVSKTRIKQIVS